MKQQTKAREAIANKAPLAYSLPAEIREGGMASKAVELQKHTAQLESLVHESHRRLFGSFPCDEKTGEEPREWPIEDIIRNCSQRIAALCGFVETINARLD